MIQNHKRLQRKPSRKNRQNRTRPIAMEQLEDRRVLSAAPVAGDDFYQVAEDSLMIASATEAVHFDFNSRTTKEPILHGNDLDLFDNAGIDVSDSTPEIVHIQYTDPNNSNEHWDIFFAAPLGRELSDGFYSQSAVRMADRTEYRAGMQVFGRGNENTSISGVFTVRDIEFDPLGELTHFDVTFEQRFQIDTNLRGRIEYLSPKYASDGVLENDTDTDGNVLTAELQSGPSHGDLRFNEDGSFLYEPDPDYFGTDTFTYLANDGIENSLPATVSIEVTPVNDAPTASYQFFDVTEDVTFHGQLVASDIDDTELTFRVTSPPRYGKVTLMPDGRFTYIPGSDLTKDDYFRWAVSDGEFSSYSQTASLRIEAVNDAPVALNGKFNVAEDTVLTEQLPHSDAERDPVTYTLTSTPTDGTLALNPEDGTFTYTPNVDFNGEVSFTFKVNDGLLDSPDATVYIDVTPVNDRPKAIHSSFTTAEDIEYHGTLTGSDIDQDTLEFYRDTPPSNGSVIIQRDGTFVYTPASDYSGSDYFRFKVFDGTTYSVSTYVSVNVTPVNDAPIAYSSLSYTYEDTPLTKQLSFRDYDSPDSDLTISIETGPTEGAFTYFNPKNGYFTYTPKLNYSGIVSFTFKVSDGELSSTSYGSIRVIAVNDIPEVQSEIEETLEDTPLVGTVTGTDIDGDELTYFVYYFGPPSKELAHGTVELNPDGSYIYTPNENFYGTDFFYFYAFDGTRSSQLGSVSITINKVNDVPELSDAVFALDENTTEGTFIDQLIASDVEDAVSDLTYAITGGSGAGTFQMDSAGKIFVAPNATLDYETTPSYKLDVEVKDTEGGVGTAQVTINLNDLFWIDIDLVPGDVTNTAKPDGSVRVAILSNSEFDAVNHMNPALLTFGKSGDEESLKLHKKHGTPQVSYSDVNGDGLLDAVVTFNMNLTGLTVENTTAILKGRLTDGTDFEINSAINITGGKGGGGGGGNNGNGGGKGGGPKNR